MKERNIAYILLGSNLGDPRQQLFEAEHAINLQAGIVSGASSIYKTAAWGDTAQPDFLNRVLVINTAMKPTQLMKKLLDIEHRMGRVRLKKNDARTIDIDILLYNDEILDQPGITIPHPRMQFRRFVLVPMNELAPHLKHPVLLRTMEQLLAECADQLDVKKF